MVTRKQFPNHKVFEMEIGGRPFTVETGNIIGADTAQNLLKDDLIRKSNMGME